jgi:orotidine 5'-phosphate decarboxylase subfamily 1
MRNPIIAALDVPSAEEALALATQIAPAVGAFKIGKELFTAEGPDIVNRVRDTGAAVFLDLKFHDIPNTVAKAVASAVRLDVQMLTVHCSGGSEMLRAAEKSAQESAQKQGRPAPLVLGVTVLTSMDAAALGEIGAETNVGRQVAIGSARLGVFPARNRNASTASPLGSGTRHPGHPHGRGKGGRPETDALPATGHRRGGDLVGDWSSDFRRPRPPARRRANSRIVALNRNPPLAVRGFAAIFCCNALDPKRCRLQVRALIQSGPFARTTA